MLGDLASGADPDAIAADDVIEKLDETRGPARATR